MTLEFSPELEEFSGLIVEMEEVPEGVPMVVLYKGVECGWRWLGKCYVMGNVCLDSTKSLRWGKGSGVMRGERISQFR